MNIWTLLTYYLNIACERLSLLVFQCKSTISYLSNVFLDVESPILKIKFIYSEKATKFCEISNLDLSCVVTVKSTLEISQNFEAFSEYMNFIETLALNSEHLREFLISRLNFEKKVVFYINILEMSHISNRHVAYVFWNLTVFQCISNVKYCSRGILDRKG